MYFISCISYHDAFIWIYNLHSIASIWTKGYRIYHVTLECIKANNYLRGSTLTIICVRHLDSHNYTAKVNLLYCAYHIKYNQEYDNSIVTLVCRESEYRFIPQDNAEYNMGYIFVLFNRRSSNQSNNYLRGSTLTIFFDIYIQILYMFLHIDIH